MIALHGYDPSFVDDGYFRNFVRSLNPEFKLPSREAIEDMCDGIFDEARRDTFSRISKVPGRVSLAVGTVTTVEGDVLYTACHFIDGEWNLHKVIMDAYVDGYCLDYHGPLLGVRQAPLSPQSRGVCIEKIMDGFSQRDVLGNLFMLVWETKADDIRLGLWIHQAERKNTNNNPTTELISANYMDNVIRSIARCLVLDVELNDEMTSDLEGLDLTRQKRQKLLSELGLDYNLWSYDEDWYSSYCSLQVLHKEGSTGTVTGSECAKLFCKLCGEIYRAIQRISASSSPTSNICLVELFKLREVLQSQIVRVSGDNAIAYKLCNGFLDRDQGKDVVDVLREAMERLDRSIKDSYLIWSIPLILDPWYKLEYIEFIFQRAFHSEATSYISEVTKQIKKLYVEYLKYSAGANSVNSDIITAIAAGSSTDPLQAWDKYCQLRDSMTTEVTPSYQDAKTELDRYLKDHLVPQTEGFDILKWWKANSQNYPTMARMARDALAMPTCSTLSSEQMAHIRSILRGYSKAAF
ncbi:unnamed protein product [Urochloa humidicola]